jgi:hypothetical protein
MRRIARTDVRRDVQLDMSPGGLRNGPRRVNIGPDQARIPHRITNLPALVKS